MMQALIACATKRGFSRLVGAVLASNEPMLAMCRKLGFSVERNPEDHEQAVVTLDLGR